MYQMDDAVFRPAFQSLSCHAFHGFRAPVGSHIGEDLSCVSEQMPEKHGHPVQAVILCCHDEGFTNPVPVKGGIQESLHEISVGKVICPLALTLKSGSNGIVTGSFLSKTDFIEHRISYHQDAGDHGH